jgi:hypothetical protein
MTPITFEQFIEHFDSKSKTATARALQSLVKLSVDHMRRTLWFTKYYEQALNETGVEYKPNPIEPLIKRKLEVFNELQQQYEEETVVVPMGNLPIGVIHFGDPHLDNNGCDFPLLIKHLDLIKDEPGVFAGTVGDVTDNWVGRLTKLYADSSTTFNESIKLIEWFFESCNWLYLVQGNHDCFNQGSAILDLITKRVDIKCRGKHEAKMVLVFDNEASVEILARHDFRGRSALNPTHGLVKSAFMSGWGHLLVAGHTHEHGLTDIENERGKHVKCLRVRGYKKYDEYAQEKGFYEHTQGCASFTIINPYAPESDRILNFWDIETGLHVLKLLRASA